jgi:hypothetical protein
MVCASLSLHIVRFIHVLEHSNAPHVRSTIFIAQTITIVIETLQML